MSDALIEIEQKARNLSPEERACLVEILIESLCDTPAAEISAEWDLEIANRLAAFDRGEIQAVAADEVFAEARRLAR